VNQITPEPLRKARISYPYDQLKALGKLLFSSYCVCSPLTETELNLAE
jgi:hypothetical protein